MRKLREIVGGPKNRYRQSGYDLDLTYITPRLIAMAFPASGIEKLYRNSIDDIAKFFNETHGGSYLIINISGRQINESKLPNTLTFEWQDHQAPNLEMLFVICDKMLHFLNQNEKRVVGVHCNHGKGRTGTIICCFLLFCRMFKSTDLVLEFYAKKRFEKQEGYGVTQPCQIQYIRYFQDILNGKKQLPRVVTIKRVVFKGETKYSSLYFKAKNFILHKSLISTKDSKTNCLYSKTSDEENEIKMLEEIYFAGDIKLILKAHRSTMGTSTVATYSFNTAFLPQNLDEIIIELPLLSPYSLMKSENFGHNFRIVLNMKQICQCDAVRQFHLRCQKCREYLVEEEEKWKIIKNVLYRRQKLSQEEMFFVLGMEN